MSNDIVSTSRESLEKFIRELHRLATYVKILVYFSQSVLANQKGIDFVDIDLGSGEFLCGFLIWGLLPVGARTTDNEKVETYIDVSEIIRIGFKRDTAPSYVPTS